MFVNKRKLFSWNWQREEMGGFDRVSKKTQVFAYSYGAWLREKGIRAAWLSQKNF
jgi:hypothetical protein